MSGYSSGCGILKARSYFVVLGMVVTGEPADELARLRRENAELRVRMALLTGKANGEGPGRNGWQGSAEERQAFEKRLQEQLRLEHLGLLAGGIAHDFNNILAGVIGYADLLLSEAPLDEFTQSGLRGVLEGARRAANLTSQLLAYTGKFRFGVGPLLLNDVLQQMDELIRVAVARRALIGYQLAPDLPPIEIEGVHFRQLVLQLVTLAADMLQEQGGAIRIATAVEQLDPARLAGLYFGHDLAPGTYVRLAVHDDGPAIDPAFLPRISEPLSDDSLIGQNLGLTAVQIIARTYRAALEVQSESRHGATFAVYFPAAEFAADG